MKLLFSILLFLSLNVTAAPLESYVTNEEMISPVMINNMLVSSVKVDTGKKWAEYDAKELASNVCFFAGYNNLVSYSVKDVTFPNSTAVATIEASSLAQYSVPITKVNSYPSQNFSINVETGSIPVFDKVFCRKSLN